jgi:RimJ/RimL family protein N-acetyltransferase
MEEDHIHEILGDIGISDFNWKSFPPEDMVFIKIKNVTSGVLFKNHIVIKHLFLKKYFTEQGLSKELIESYLFC